MKNRQGTRLTALLAALLCLATPAAQGVEIGDDDFRVSFMGTEEDPSIRAHTPAVAHNSTDNEYLVVWSSDNDSGGLADNEHEIFGQLYDATGSVIGNNFRISETGGSGDPDFDAFEPAVVYNSVDNEFFVVWYSDDSGMGLVDDEFEVFGQRLGSDGSRIGVDHIRISFKGDGTSLVDVFGPAVAYNSTDNEYLVVWQGDDTAGVVVDNEFEIWGQHVEADTGQLINPVLRLSDMGGSGDTSFFAFRPAVAYDATDDEYLVVWYGVDNTGNLSSAESEVFGQRVDATTGLEIGSNDFRISHAGPDEDNDFFAGEPDVTYNGTDNEYLVVWYADDGSGGLADDEFEIFGQRLDAATGLDMGVAGFRISDMGPLGVANLYPAWGPKVAYLNGESQYVVVWYGSDESVALNEQEVYAQRLDADGSEIGPDDLRISDIGPIADNLYYAKLPAVAYNITNHELLVAWESRQRVRGFQPPSTFYYYTEYEIYSQRLATELFADGFESGDTSAW